MAGGAVAAAKVVAKTGLFKKLTGITLSILFAVVLGVAALTMLISSAFQNAQEEHAQSDPSIAVTPIPANLLEHLVKAAAQCRSLDDPALLAALVNNSSGWNSSFVEGDKAGLGGLTLEEFATHRQSETEKSDDLRLDPVESLYAVSNQVCSKAERILADKGDTARKNLHEWVVFSYFTTMDVVVATGEWASSAPEDMLVILSYYPLYQCALVPGSCVNTASCDGLPVGEQYMGGNNSLWGGHLNGRIPSTSLGAVTFSTNQQLHPCAQQYLTLMNNEYRANFGRDISITDSYRPYADQVAVYQQKPHLAAKPGTSNHGWGLALDLAVGGFDSEIYKWLHTHGKKYGWHNPSWAVRGGSKPEPWHFEFLNNPTVQLP